jgi:hypothetical protein
MRVIDLSPGDGSDVLVWSSGDLDLSEFEKRQILKLVLENRRKRRARS